jgi:hypothetical protein
VLPLLHAEKEMPEKKLKLMGQKRDKVSTKDDSWTRSLQIFLIRVEQSARETAVLEDYMRTRVD